MISRGSNHFPSCYFPKKHVVSIADGKRTGGYMGQGAVSIHGNHPRSIIILCGHTDQWEAILQDIHVNQGPFLVQIKSQGPSMAQDLWFQERPVNLWSVVSYGGAGCHLPPGATWTSRNLHEWLAFWVGGPSNKTIQNQRSLHRDALKTAYKWGMKSTPLQ